MDPVAARSRALAAVDALKQVLAIDPPGPHLPQLAPGLLQLLNHAMTELVAEVEAQKPIDEHSLSLPAQRNDG